MDELLALIERIGGDDAPTASELTEARDELARIIHAAKADATLEELEGMNAAYRQIVDALAAAEEVEAERAAEVDKILGDIPDPDAAAGTDSAAPETDVVAEAEAITEDAAEPVAASVMSLSEATARFRTRQVTEPETSEPSPTLRVTSRGREFDAASFTFLDAGRAARDVMKSPGPGKHVIFSSTMQYPDEFTLSGDPERDTGILNSAIDHGVSVAAAGGCCSIAEPIRDQQVLSTTDRPVRAALPTVGAPSGAVSFYPAVCLPTGGVDLWTCDDDAAVDPDDPETWKDCLSIDCPDEVRVNVEAIYRCLTIGNFQARFAPQQWAAVLTAVEAAQARLAEQTLLAGMINADSVTSHTATATGDAWVTLAQAIMLAARTIRNDQRMGMANLNVFLASWWKEAIKASTVAHSQADGNGTLVTDQWIDAQFAAAGLNPVWSDDLNPIHDTGAQVDGALDEYPDNGDVIIAHPSHFGFLDGGQLDLGAEIRDHDLNRQNAVAAFAESWEGLMDRGCNAKHLTVPADVCTTVLCGGA